MEMEKKQEGKVSMEEMMEVYKKLAIPGVPHRILADLAGIQHGCRRADGLTDEHPDDGDGGRADFQCRRVSLWRLGGGR